jgi:glyoxylase-like metal-dependent hydrolase (beta-lactamase superfamily II)
MAYTGAVQPHGPTAVQDLGDVVIRKASVSEQDNNVYLLTCRRSGGQLLVDAADDVDRLQALIAEGERDGGRGLEVIVTTHQHGDHHRALAALAEATGARTLAGLEDAEALPVPVDQSLRHGDTIGFGEQHLDVIGLRGHTPGSVALLLTAADGGRHLITGDSLFPGGPGKTTSPEDFRSLMTDLEERVFGMLPDSTWVYPGHGDDTTLGAERGSIGQWWARGW